MRDWRVRLSEFPKNHDGSMTVEFVALAPLVHRGPGDLLEFGRAFWAYDVVTRDLRAVFATCHAMLHPRLLTPAMLVLAALNIAQTGSPTDSADANKHFPWRGVSATFSCPVARTISAAEYNDAGYVIRMDASADNARLLVIANRPRAPRFRPTRQPLMKPGISETDDEDRTVPQIS
jgi:hypothetical protein